MSELGGAAHRPGFSGVAEKKVLGAQIWASKHFLASGLRPSHSHSDFLPFFPEVRGNRKELLLSFML